MRKTILFYLVAPALLAVSTVPAAAQQAFEPNWESLKRRNPAPNWFRDAKFGIYFHWGAYCVPAFGSEWYPRTMHIKQNGEYRHHKETWGDPTEFGYADFVPMFKAEKFDANEWAELFEKAGARFAGPVAEHHDGFSMWASKLTPWNAKDKGPQRDITGELATAIRKRGMKLVTSFHHARNNLWQKNGQWTGHYEFVKKDFPSLLQDPERAILYGYMPREKFLDMWQGKLIEVIDNYQPDLIWFDSWLDEIPDEYKMAFLAHYFNQAQQWGREVVVTCKQRDITPSVALEDYEKGRTDRLTDYTWLTDDTISKGSWCYTDDLQIKSTPEVLHVLIDIVSKNGQLLLNISPKADGTIPEVQKNVLLGIGDWLGKYGEAIYETRPWLTFGEGPTRLRKGGHFVRMQGGYTPQDIRYTRKGATVYAIVLGWPGDNTEVLLKSFGQDRLKGNLNVTNVSMLGSDTKVAYARRPEGLAVTTGGVKIDDMAVVFKIETSGYATMIDESRILTLSAAAAVLEGDQIDLENKGAGENIGFWDNPKERVHWLLKVAEAGQYTVQGKFAAAAGRSLVRVRIGDRQMHAQVPPTDGWDKPKQVRLGQIRIETPGVYHVILEPANAGGWKPLNLWQIEFIKTR